MKRGVCPVHGNCGVSFIERGHYTPKPTGGASGEYLPTSAFVGISHIFVSATEPQNPQVGDIWIDVS
jgi:hypothetical protein